MTTKYSKKLANGGEVGDGQDRAPASSAPAFGGFFDRMFKGKGSDDNSPLPAPVVDTSHDDEPAKAPAPKEASNAEVEAFLPKDEPDFDKSAPSASPAPAPAPKRAVKRAVKRPTPSGSGSGPELKGGDGRGSSESKGMTAYKSRAPVDGPVSVPKTALAGPGEGGGVLKMSSTADGTSNTDSKTLFPKKLANGGPVNRNKYAK